MTATVAWCSSIYTAALPDIMRDLGCSQIVATLGVTTFLLGFGFGSLLFAPLSEIWGRTQIFRLTMGLFVAFQIGCALAPNITSLIIFRFFAGFFGSPTVSNSGGSITDLWPQSNRSVPMACFSAASFLGPVFAPVVGGFISQYAPWRWNFWVVLILSGVVYVAVLFFLPETYPTKLLYDKARRLGRENEIGQPEVCQQLRSSLTRPWLMLCTEPILFLLSLYMAFIYGILYLDFTAYPIVYKETRDWSAGMAGLSFLGIGVGMTLATIGSPYINVIHRHFVLRLGPQPEARLPHLIILAWLIPISLFWFGWTAKPPTHWICGIVAGAPFGFSIIPLFLGIMAYLTDCYGPYGASALAANGVLRSIFGAVFPLFAQDMYKGLGVSWATSILGFVSLAMTPLPWMFYRSAEGWVSDLNGAGRILTLLGYLFFYSLLIIMNVGIVGAGISGLYIALSLQRQGHNVTVFEATSRIGGRIYTHRFQPLNEGEDVYFEAGAMRIPRSSLHDRVFHFVQFLNTYGKPEDKVELIPYVIEHENNIAYVQGHKADLSDIEHGARLGIPQPYRGKSARELLGEVVTPWLKLLERDFDQGFAEIMKYDTLSFRSYLALVQQWPHEVIDFVELMTSQSNQYDLSFVEIIMQNLDFNVREWFTVGHGMSRLTQGAAKLVGLQNIHTNSPVDRLVENSDGRITLHAHGPIPFTGTFDKVVLAIPPAALQGIRERPTWSFMKEQAIRSAHFEPLYKIGLHFRTRFWEQLSAPSFGGQSATDLRFRWIVYPSNDLGTSGSGVLLLYCWMNDAYRIQSVPRDQRVRLALHDLQRFFADTGVDIYSQYVDSFDICWSNEYVTGDAMFLPGQFSRFHRVAAKPEGNIHFAGEHLSRHHTWISGAMESAQKAVQEISGEMDARPLGEEEYTRQFVKAIETPPRRVDAIPEHERQILSRL
ncbi:major facilitator superfamily domain-containing protein [Aspergillus tamarii]|uniref:Major facilitator superfamily domain-containing protein n=1 Tax=Aspergillus tamarii TaxID=41984 RepID=A0A5N6VA79_ASPTM|nr:major facilitator superfamily domain-containing protein [Aspergillus tamarii]